MPEARPRAATLVGETQRKKGEIKHQMTRKSITCVALVSIFQLSKIPVILGKFKRIFLMQTVNFNKIFRLFNKKSTQEFSQEEKH